MTAPASMSSFAKVRAALVQLSVRRDARRVVFASFGGRYSDNPRAIYEELVARGGYGSTWVAERGDFPDGVERVAPMTVDYARAVGAAGVVVANARLTHYVKRPGVTYLQTWHGTPLKRIGFDNPQYRADRAGLRRASSDYRRWDYLISQNAFSTDIFRRAFRFDGEILETGYPRNDVLRSAGADAVRRQTRQRLGLADDRLVVLYAPTFRDDAGAGGSAPGLALDLQRLESALGGRVHVLTRLHHRDATRLTAQRSAFWTDVSAYGDIRELYLASDALVTDYSSTMFDYAVTGRPIVFFTYDLERYRDDLRGFYFDLATEAPGPLCATNDELVERLGDLEATARAHSTAYDAFTRRYCYLDDGHAAARVVDRVFSGY